MKTIGVIGGLGPQATMDFEARLHRAAQRLLPARGNSGYPPMVVYYHRRPPFVADERGAPRMPLEPDPALLEAARWIGAKADFLVITSNAPHLFQDAIEEASGREVLSLIAVTVEAVRERGWRRVGVVGMGDPVVYTRRMEEMGLASETLPPEPRQGPDAAILRLMEGREDEGSRGHARSAIGFLRSRRVDGIILGCTEIPLLLGGDGLAPDLLNPAELLAEAAVRRAIG